MAGRTPYNQTPNPIASRGNAMGMGMGRGSLFSKSPTIDVLHNCDLPPPLNVFPENEMMLVLHSKSTILTKSTREEKVETMRSVSIRDEKLEILKALRLSQTRAREAERRAAVLTKERDVISNALIHESSQLFAYRQWVKLLEVQVSMLQRQHQAPVNGGRKNKEDDNEGGGGSMVWFVALALCFSIASLGFALVSDTYLDPILL